MTITSQQIQDLRVRTGAGIVDVKNALVEAGGDSDKAIEILRKKGQAQAVKKSSREQGEGGIFIAATDGKAALVVVKCETDFVGRSDAFVELGTELAKKLLDEGKPGFDTFAKDRVPAAVLKLGENVSVGDAVEITADVVGTYVHSNRKIGVIVGLKGGTKQQAIDASMHAAAMNPLYVTPEEVSAESVNKEREIWKEQMKGDKKPPEIQQKIMAGKEKKFREENALITQSFVKDQAQTVGTMLGSAQVTAYKRIAL